MEEKEKKAKRIRHPKKKEQEKEEQPKHFVLEVQDGNGFSNDGFVK